MCHGEKRYAKKIYSEEKTIERNPPENLNNNHLLFFCRDKKFK